jgi:tetratricopeptide (TPR) repeat protein
MLIAEHVIVNNKWQRPIYFTGNPAGKSRLELERHTTIVGSVFQIIPGDANYDFDYERTAALMSETFNYRSYNDPTIGLDDNAVGLAIVFPEKQIAISDWYRRAGDTAKAEEWLNDALQRFPSYWRTYDVKAQYLEAQGDSTEALAVMDRGIDTLAAFVREMPDNRMYWYHWGKLCEAAERDEEAEEGLSRAFYINPYDQQVYQSYVAFLIGRQKTAEAAKAAGKWLEYYPSDTRAQSISNPGKTLNP